MQKTLSDFRYFLKDSVRQTIDFTGTGQGRGAPPPPVQKPCSADATLIPLAPPDVFAAVCRIGLLDAIRNRRSRREFAPGALSLDELAFLLWATQGVQERYGDVATLRTVPSAGARHSFETYLYVQRVTGLSEGVYRYLPLDHKLALEFSEAGFRRKFGNACFGQPCCADGAVVFIWATIPARMEWRYGLAAHRVIAMDAGHVCQNLYLACEAIDAGTCAIGAYEQDAVDALLHLDGDEEFVIYLAPVGKVR